jgi:ABC-2 type transport system permease protein
MKNAWTIAQREVGAYFVSPMAYVVTAPFLFLLGILFERILFYSREATLRYLFHNLAFLLVFVVPLLSMRLLAEEQRSGTLELLLTSPVRDWEVVLGKFLAVLALFVVMLALTLLYPLVLLLFGDPDMGPILSGYLGVLLMGSSMLAIGVFTSSLSQNQIIAGVLGIVILLFLWLMEAFAQAFGPPISTFLSNLSLPAHFPDFAKGVIDSKDVVYYLSVTAAGLFLATRSLETRRWK